MVAMNGGYYKSAWTDIKQSKGWFSKLLLLGLLQLVPIFGQIVFYGYALGWARELAWGTRAPMSQRIFSNADGKLYRHGGFAWVIALVWGIVPMVFVYAGMFVVDGALSSSSYSYYSHQAASGMGGMMALGVVLVLLSLVLLCASVFFVWAGQMRMLVYDRIGAGFQMGKIWKMLRAGSDGIWRIFGMNLLVSCIVGVVVVAFAGVLFLVFMLPLTAAFSLAGGPYGSVLGVLVGIVLLYTCVCLLALFLEVFVSLLVYRALGYWLAQFSIASWPSMDSDVVFQKMPPAGQAPAGAASAPGSAQAGWQQPAQGAPVPGNAWQQPAPGNAWQQPMVQSPQAWQQPVQSGAWQQPAPQAAPVQQSPYPAARAQAGAWTQATPQPVSAQPLLPAQSDRQQD